MTTKIIVDTGAGLSVKVEVIEESKDIEKTTSIDIVKPYTEKVFYIHGNKKLLITELD